MHHFVIAFCEDQLGLGIYDRAYTITEKPALTLPCSKSSQVSLTHHFVIDFWENLACSDICDCAYTFMEKAGLSVTSFQIFPGKPNTPCYYQLL